MTFTINFRRHFSLFEFIQAFPFRHKLAVKPERFFVDKAPVMIVVLQRIQIAAVIIDQPLHDRFALVKRKIADLDGENDVGQAVCVKLDIVFFEMLDAHRDAVVSDRRVVKNDRAVFVQNVETKFKIGQNRFVRVLAVDKTKLHFFVDLRRRYLARIAVDRSNFVRRRNFREQIEHPLRRIIQIGVIDSAIVRLMQRALVDRINARAFRVQKMRLNASAEIRSDLQIVVMRRKPARRKMARKQRLPVVFRKLGVDLLEKLCVEIRDRLFKIVHFYLRIFGIDNS